MTGSEFLARNTNAVRARQQIPNHAPARWRRTTDATKPKIARPVTTMSRKVVHGKNMSQYESVTPSGRPWYFMSVMYAWLARKGTTQNALSSTAPASTVNP